MTELDPDPRYWPTPAAYRIPEHPMPLDPHVDATPPDTDHAHDSGDHQAMRIEVTVYDHATDRAVEASVQLHGDDCGDPSRFAAALLDAALGCAAVRGPGFAWAAAAAFAAFDGTRR